MEIQSAINKTKGVIYILKMARRFHPTEAEYEHFLRLYKTRFELNAILIKEKAPH